MEADIRDLLQSAGVSFKQNSKSFIMDCPRCSKKQKLYIRRKDGRFVCWYCRESEGFQGRPEYALKELCGLPLNEIRKKLYGEEAPPASVLLDLNLDDYLDESDGDFAELSVSPLKELAWPFEFLELTDQRSLPGCYYLLRRGIPLSVAVEYGIRYSPSTESVVFPCMLNGKLYGWQQRKVKNDQPYWDPRSQKMVTPLKTVTSTDFPRDHALLFMDRLTGSDHAVLTEGPFDALKAHLCGGNVASMGKAISKQQLELVRNSGVKKVYIGLDPDAWLEINRIRTLLGPDVVVYDLRPPAPYKDLGEMDLEEVKKLFDNAPVLNPADVVLYLKDHFGE